MVPDHLISALFPYTTLFRSERRRVVVEVIREQPSIAQLVGGRRVDGEQQLRSEEHTSELQSRVDLVCRILLEKKKNLDRDTTVVIDCHRELLGTNVCTSLIY